MVHTVADASPQSAESIRDALTRIHAESVAYWASFNTAGFLAPIGAAWSPADNVRHLTKSVQPLTRGLELPRLVVRLRFGGSKRPSRNYEQMRTDYRRALAAGGQAGKFAPTPLTHVVDAEAERARIMSSHVAAINALAAALIKWPERALDRCQMPHPLMGLLTVREMLFFTLYHNQHHVEVVRQRRAGVVAEPPRVIAVCRSDAHGFSKSVVPQIRLVEGLGVEGDAHLGVTVQHRSRVAQNPDQPNLRQVHLMHAELFEELLARGFTITPGDIGENITTRGIDLLGLPVDTELQLGDTARVRITGLRNPCHQLNDFCAGLTKAVLEKRSDGSVIRKSGIMGVVLSGGVVTAGDIITVFLPPEPHQPLDRV